MDKEEIQRICENIYKYILKELCKWIDDEIFTKRTMEGLGELYYNHILNVVENADEELLNRVIKVCSSKSAELNCQKDYYCAICELIDIVNLPSEMMVDVKKQYDEIFVQNYNVVLQKYQSELANIRSKLNQAKNDSDIIKNAPANHSLMRDISTDENRLYELCSECNSLRTRKEMLEFAMEYVNSKLAEFCDAQDPSSVEQAQKYEAMKLSKDDTYAADFAFFSYRNYVEIVEDDIDRPYALFYKVKFYVVMENARKNYRYSCYTKSDEEDIEEYKQFVNSFPKFDDLYSYKSSNPGLYNETLGNVISNYGLIEELTENLKSSVCLRERKSILIKAVELYKQGEFEIFNSILPIQIEGMFADYLRDATTFLRFSKMDIYINAVLKDKIRHLQDVKSDIYPEAVEYFMYYFNNMIRNKIAHGRYNGNPENRIQDEIFSKELILDMGMLVHMLSRKSETEKMYRFIHGYQKYYRRVIRSSEHPCFGALFNDMIGAKLISDYDIMEKYRPIQVVYWLVNPYYEKIYEQVEDKSDLLELRAEFLSKEFWEYSLDKLNNVISHGYDYLNINMEFMSVVKGLFNCNVTSEVKQVLGKVNSALIAIKDIQNQ